MSSTPELTTELSAVNSMLASIGERPVSNLDNQKKLDVAKAVTVLNRINVSVQTRGWYFNREAEITLSVDSDGQYIIPKNIVNVDPTDVGTVDRFTQRGNKLYNLKTRLFTGHTADIQVDWIRILPFDDMPEVGCAYVAARAGVTYQGEIVGSPILFEFTEKEALTAYGLLQQAELDEEDISLETSPLIVDAVYYR